MSDRIVITNIRPYDGEYDLELQDRPLTALEWRWIKKLAGYLPGTFRDGLEGSDPDLVCVLAVIAMYRSGRVDRQSAPTVFDRISDAPFDGAAISLISDPVEEDDGRPPAEPTETS